MKVEFEKPQPGTFYFKKQKRFKHLERKKSAGHLNQLYFTIRFKVIYNYSVANRNI